MPIIKSAKKALRQSKKRTLVNRAKKDSLKAEIKLLKKKKDPKLLLKVYSLADRLVKTGVIHKNKASRIKSVATKLVAAKKA